MKKHYFLLITLCITSFINAQIVNIPDANFKSRLLSANAISSNLIAKDLNGNYFKIDANSDGEIQVSEALQVSYLDLNSLFLFHIIDLTGIEYFSNLQVLICNNNQLSSVNLGDLTNLVSLNCSNNQLSSLNLSGLTNLQDLSCGFNQLPSLNISGLINLQTLNCINNQLTSLNTSGLINLKDLTVRSNQLNLLNVNGSNNLQELDCYSNQLTLLDVSGLTNLQRLYCNSNQLTSLDVSGLTKLMNLWCQGNQLTTLFMKNGSVETTLDFSNNPNLQYICADESQIADVQNKITTYGYTNCYVNSYCSFVPGGTFYIIQGNNKYDQNNNGCDADDINFPNLKFNISDGTTSGSFISNTQDNYSIPVQAGTHTMIPSLENLTYFTVSPTTVTVTFPTQATPFTKDFCIAANGIHPDLEVSCMPLTRARPGFDTKYKIIYKNKGTNTQSGTVNMTFDDAVLDLISANPVPTTVVTDNLSWSFSNLLPFETREITVTLNVNSPVETPAVNSGYILTYATNITSTATDETPQDNTFVLNQTVVNSLDPNDKTCLEGKTIAPSTIGDYVHYMIRFENNGTANAQNIVVKDMIDTTKFDVSSLIPIKGSHNFTTRISDTNKVEFIFQDINLPFDDANNDGYVMFKIKTKPTLVTGNTFSNTASIYFDYNAPIVTNTATTTIQTLGTQDFDFDNYFTLYPNPAATVLNISSKNTIELKSISIYNTLGQLVMVIPNAQDTKAVDVSQLTTGNYFIKMNTDKGVSVSKFLKK